MQSVTSFVSLLSSSGVTIEEIAHLVGHGRSSVTERVYRKELRPVITRGARNQRALRWRRQALGRQVNRSKAKRGVKAVKESLTRAFIVGDTGFEPVTSSVSGQNLCA
jgi:hypothetical protein